ncbi:adenylyl-sulfate kinase [Cohnella pontilimi]|uniref:Adenylyl-sulfate kinase n=1 Tax=Cohnella pontilimi TaxID=2564100 RepID=A0A4U0FGL2_9BACL|nr:adenylyl-sulfate kinase [Cohnella pontilimi]TJY44075.1 adenylyl-sulfate kinase [Cohnella pontilimi]
MNQGMVVWFTGLPNSGKSTVSRLVAEKLEAMGYAVERLDSDELPRSLTKELSPDWTTRQKQKCSNLIFIAKLLSKYKVIVLIASVGRFEQMRVAARTQIERYVEIYLKCSLETRLQRDDKTKYVRYPDTIHYYEEPALPEMTIPTDQYSPAESASAVIQYLMDQGYIAERDNMTEHTMD